MGESGVAWSRVLMAHRTEAYLAAPLPPGVELDRRTGRPWVSLVAFVCSVPRHGARPLRFRQLSRLALVEGPFGPGFVHLETWVDRSYRDALWSALDHLVPPGPWDGPRVRLDPTLRIDVDPEAERPRVEARCGRHRAAGGVEPGRRAEVRPGSLDAVLLDRDVVYGATPGASGWAVRLVHAPGRVRAASVEVEGRGPATRAHFVQRVDDLRVTELRRLPAPGAERRLSA